MICDHLSEFYAGQGVPPIFCLLQEDDVPPGAVVKFTKSDTGDDCHLEIDGTTQKALKRHYRERRSLENFVICDGGQPRTLTLADINALAPD